MKNDTPTCGSPEARAVDWIAILARYRKPDALRSGFEIAVTVLPYVVLWTLSATAILHGYWWLGLPLTIPAAGFLVRLFILQHDCGHGALFARRRENDWIGRVLGVLTLTPYDYWRRTHAVHHATAGNLDKRGIGDVTTLTVGEYRAKSRWGRLCYWLYRNPFVMFGLGPAWLFICQYRLPIGLMKAGIEPWVSTITTSLGAAGVIILLIWIMGAGPFMAVQMPITLLAGAAGVWLFFIQHQFEETHWADGEKWDFHHASLHGSSFYDLPLVLRWFSGNIGIHHLHHLSARVPFYRLPEVLRDYPELRRIGRISLLESLRCIKLVLWDEKAKRLVSFREARTSQF